MKPNQRAKQKPKLSFPSPASDPPMGDEAALLPFGDSGEEDDSSSSSNMISGTGEDAEEAPEEDAAVGEDSADAVLEDAAAQRVERVG